MSVFHKNFFFIVKNRLFQKRSFLLCYVCFNREKGVCKAVLRKSSSGCLFFFACLSASLSAHLTACAPVGVGACLSVHLSAHLSVSLTIFLSVTPLCQIISKLRKSTIFQKYPLHGTTLICCLEPTNRLTE